MQVSFLASAELILLDEMGLDEMGINHFKSVCRHKFISGKVNFRLIPKLLHIVANLRNVFSLLL